MKQNKGTSDEEIFRDMGTIPTEQEMKQVKQVIEAWAIACDEIPQRPTVRIIFIACLHMLITMGPAYCMVAALNLARVAREYDNERPDSD